MVYCCVPFCKSDKNKLSTESKISFHQFPSDIERRTEWIEAICRKDTTTGGYWTPGDYSVVCSLHFSSDCFKTHTKHRALIKGSVPTIFPGYPSYLLKKQKKSPRKRPSLDRVSTLPTNEEQEILPCSNESLSNSNEFQNNSSNILLLADVSSRSDRQELNSQNKIPSYSNGSLSNSNEFQNNGSNSLLFAETFPSSDEQEHNFQNKRPSCSNGCLSNSNEFQNNCNNNVSLVEVSTQTDKQECCFQNNLKIASLEQSRIDLKRKYSTKMRHIRRLNSKIDKLQEEISKLKQTVQESQNRVDAFNLTALEEGIRTKDTKAVFLRDQIKAYGKRKINWSDSTVEHAIFIYDKSPTIYGCLRKMDIFSLPSRNTIARYIACDEDQ